MNNQNQPITPDENLPPPAPPVNNPQPTLPKYDWTTPQAARHSLRVICDEEGLSVDMKNQLCDTVSCESGFITNPKPHKNSDGTTDWGICQFNDGVNKKTGKPYWIGTGAAFSSVDEVISNPEKCVRIMARTFKQGGQHLWACYTKLFG